MKKGNILNAFETEKKGNEIGSTRINTVSEMLKVNTTLSALDLRGLK